MSPDLPSFAHYEFVKYSSPKDHTPILKKTGSTPATTELIKFGI